MVHSIHSQVDSYSFFLFDLKFYSQSHWYRLNQCTYFLYRLFDDENAMSINFRMKQPEHKQCIGGVYIKVIDCMSRIWDWMDKMSMNQPLDSSPPIPGSHQSCYNTIETLQYNSVVSVFGSFFQYSISNSMTLHFELVCNHGNQVHKTILQIDLSFFKSGSLWNLKSGWTCILSGLGNIYFGWSQTTKVQWTMLSAVWVKSICLLSRWIILTKVLLFVWLCFNF